MSTLIFSKKADLIDALEARRAEFAQADREALAAHKKDEAAYLAAFRTACREALKWDYVTASKNHFTAEPIDDQGRKGRRGAPSCPVSQVQRLDNLLLILSESRQERFTVDRRGRWRAAWDLLVGDRLDASSMC